MQERSAHIASVSPRLLDSSATDVLVVCLGEKWRIREERAAEQLAATSSLRWTRLFPESPAIQVVAIDGVVVGRVRHSGGRWIATGNGQWGPVADCDTFRAAPLALACEAEPW